MTSSDANSQIAFYVRALANSVSTALGKRLSSKKVTVAEWTMLWVLEGEQPIAPSLLALRMGMSRGAISKLAERLIQKSLVVRKVHKEDGYDQALELAPKGKRLFPALYALAQETEAEFFDRLSFADRGHLDRIVRHLVRESDR